MAPNTREQGSKVRIFLQQRLRQGRAAA